MAAASPDRLDPASPSPFARRRVVVVGGGVAGLVAARSVALEHPDADVVLLEGSDRVGGKLRLERVAGQRVDVGAEAMLAVRPEGVDLVRELGREDELVSPATTSASIWSRGALHPVPRATLMGVPSSADGLDGLLTPDEVRRLVDEQPWPGGGVSQDVSVGAYIAQRLGQAVVDRLVEPLLGGVYAGRADELSLEATMPAVWRAAVAGESMSEVARASAPARPVSSSPPPSARPVFAGLRGGMGRLSEILLAGMPGSVEVRTAAMVRGIDRGQNGFGVLVGPTVAEERLTADAVIIATPPTAAGRLVSSLAPEAAEALREIPTSSSAVVTLAFPRAAMPDLVGSGFLVPAVDGRFIKGATFSGNKWSWTDALDPELVFVRASIGRAGEAALLQQPDDVLVARCLADLEQAVGASLPDPVDSHVQRWGGGLPQYTVGHVARMARVRTGIESVPGLEVAGAAYQGVGIPAVIASARAAAAAVTAYLIEAAPRTPAQ